ncbi:FG-GAP-like repeat-containing protein [Streptomyces sp. CRN 30]|uniref:FG-GAP-like repeat-containing protein n=1 Tax=Streptomyces sp. CRN 30 TaxID=3075613 RepID=UPI002A8273AC|nr:FG-GAP-like repeat-containing protein [Streptomyces sp. CRN 30]
MTQRALRLTVAAAVALAATSAAVPAVQAAGATPRAAAAGPGTGDFNGDGVTDVAVAAPGDAVNGRTGAGYVAVTYGIAGTAPSEAAARKVYHQNSPGVPGSAEQDDAFGSSLTSADLDGDGYTDLVVGSAGEDTDAIDDAGSLTVMWGGANGLSGGTVLKGDRAAQRLGEALATGDFDGDGRPDVAAGTSVSYGPFDRVAGADRTEALELEVGGPEDVLWNRPVLAAGDVDGDGSDDLVAVVSHGSGELPYHGPRLVQYLAGGSGGLSPARTLTDGPTGRTLDGGVAVAVGDLDGDGRADVVLGRTGDGDMTGTEDVEPLGGAVEILRGTAAGPDTTTSRTLLHQGTAGIQGSTEYGDDFGAALSLGDVNGDGHLDLAVGAPGEDVGDAVDAGSVTVLLGTASGPTGTGAKTFTQDTASVPGAAEASDRFGGAVRIGDVDGDGRGDLFAGAPGENDRSGGVWVLPAGTGGQVTAAGSVTFGSGSLGTVAAEAHLGSGFDD